jgi:AraC-like DNA-binding protein
VHAAGLRHRSLARSPTAGTAVAALLASECTLDAPGLSLPRAEPQLVVRFGPKAHRGLDLHVMGARHHARRKNLHRGQRVVTARLHLGMHEAVFGVPPSATAGRVVPLDSLWGEAAERLTDQLAAAEDLEHAAAMVDQAIAARLAAAGAGTGTVAPAHYRLALEAAARLSTARVNEVAEALGVSERNLRRVFRAVIGMSPKIGRAHV